MRSADCRLGGKAATIPLRASTPPREAPMTTMSRGSVRLTGGPSRLPGSMLTIRSLLFLSRHSVIQSGTRIRTRGPRYQPFWARLQLLARLTLNPGKHAGNEPARLAHLDD